eukprot:3246656-Pyramimonas_sp.AAC.1
MSPPTQNSCTPTMSWPAAANAPSRPGFLARRTPAGPNASTFAEATTNAKSAPDASGRRAAG